MRNIKLLTFLFFLFINITYVFAQIPNPGFESWIDENTPQDWITDNIPTINVITRSGDAHSGTYAVHGEVANFSVYFYPPTLQAGQSGYFAYTQRAETFNGYYKFNNAGSDALYLFAYLFNSQEVIAYAQSIINQSATGYTSFSIPFTYATGTQPDSAEIFIVLGGDTSITQPHGGSWFTIDDLSFSGEVPTGVSENAVNNPKYDLQQNYPNPFNPVTTIRYEIPQMSYVTLKVFNVNGEEVATLQNGELPAGQHQIKWNAENLPSGFYFYRINAGNYSSVRKMILLK